MPELRTVSYEEARLKYFREQRDAAERRMDYWRRLVKKGNTAGWLEAQDRASQAGFEYNFNKDALEAFGEVGEKDDFFGAVLNCAVRYCLGRTSYMPVLVIDYITPMLPRLTKKTLWCFQKDIEGCENYGMDMDKEKWMEFLAKVKEAIANAENA